GLAMSGVASEVRGVAQALIAAAEAKAAEPTPLMKSRRVTPSDSAHSGQSTCRSRLIGSSCAIKAKAASGEGFGRMLDGNRLRASGFRFGSKTTDLYPVARQDCQRQIPPGLSGRIDILQLQRADAEIRE